MMTGIQEKTKANVSTKLIGKKFRRYPGSSSFQSNEVSRLIFKGRRQEKILLLQKVLANKLVVVFAPSGAGKTSLINAGLQQQLIEKKYYPIKLRFEQDKKALIDQFHEQISNQTKADNIQVKFHYPKFIENNLEDFKNLPWVFFKYNEFWFSDYVQRTPVLIFDQFEDIFMRYKKSDRKKFLEGIGDLSTGRIPEPIRKKDVLKSDLQDIFNYEDTTVNAKILISIREDFLGFLYELSNDIPVIFNNCFRLSQLDRRQAESAIVEPAKIENDSFDSPPFKYEPESLSTIFQYLQKDSNSPDRQEHSKIEPFQLQIICEHCEEKIIKKAKKVNSKENIINKEDIGGTKGIEKIFKNYYKHQFVDLNIFQKRRFYRLFEKGLISESRTRENLGEKRIGKKYHIKGEELHRLRQNRLIHRFSRGEETYFELSHDNLIPIVLNEKKRRRRIIRNIFLLIMALSIILPAYIYNRTQLQINNLLLEAKKLSINGEFQIALDRYRQIIKLDSRNIHALKGMADNNFYLKKYNEAITNYEAIINKTDVKEDKIVAYIGKAKSYSQLGKLNEVIQSYQDLIEKIDQNNYTANDELAKIYFDKKDYDSAKDFYLKLMNISIEIDPCLRLVEIYKIKKEINIIPMAKEAVKRASAKPNELNNPSGVLLNTKYERVFNLIKVGDKMIELEIYDIALDAYQKSVAEAKKNIQTHFNDMKHALNRIGLIHNENKNHNQAVTAYQEVLEYGGDNIAAHQGLGHAYTKSRDFRNAIQHYQKALEKDKNNFDVNKELAYCYTLKENPEYEKAIDHYKRVIILAKEIIQSNRENEKKDEAKQELPALLIGLGDVYLRQGDFDLSKSQYLEAIGISAERIDFKLLSIHLNNAYNGLADCLHGQEKLDQAQIIYELALAINPDNFKTHLKMANLKLRKNNYEEAAALYLMIIDKDPDNSNLDVHKGLGSAYTRMGKFKEAEYHYQKLLKISQHQKKLQHKYDAYLGLGFVYYKNGVYDKSKDNYEKALKYEPLKPFALSGLGSVYEMKGDFKNAEIFYQQALKLVPHLKPARDGLNRLLNSIN